MQKFATACALAVSASAVDSTKGTKGTMQMSIDNFDSWTPSMPQGDGQDHTLWSWSWMLTNGGLTVAKKTEEEEHWRDEELKKNEDIGTYWEKHTSIDVDRQLNCELHRREELNLYYQCTQNSYNHYSLDHFGGEMRSFPRWIYEFKRCNMMLAAAECSTLTDKKSEEVYNCFEEPCTQITLPMPEMFGETGVVVPVVVPEVVPEVIPEVVHPECGPLPDVSMLSVYRYKDDHWPLNMLIRDNATFFCIEMKRDEGSIHSGTINVKMPGNYKLEPNYNIRTDPRDCSIDIKSVNAEKYVEGRKLAPYGEPFEGYDAFSFEYSDTPAEKYDAKVGYCECDVTTGACEGHFDKAVEDGFM